MITFLVFVLMFGFVMDGYAVFLRVAGVEGLAEVLAMANLVQYIARISNVVVIFALSFALRQAAYQQMYPSFSFWLRWQECFSYCY